MVQMGCSVIPSGFGAASGTGELLGREGRQSFFCSAHRSQAIHASLRLVPRFACLSALNKLSTELAACLSRWDLARLPFLTPLRCHSLSSHSGRGILRRRHTVPFSLPVQSPSWQQPLRGHCHPVFRAKSADEASVGTCMLTLQPGQCLSELSIRVTATCQAVC